MALTELRAADTASDLKIAAVEALRLKLPYVLRQGRLARVEGVRGLAVTVRVGNGEEHLELPERHAISLDLLV